MKEAFERIASLSELKSVRAKNASVNGTAVALFYTSSKVYAVENNCPHQHFALLHEGLLEECTITCPMHGRTFNLETGVCLTDSGTLRRFEVRVVGDDVLVLSPPRERDFKLFDR